MSHSIAELHDLFLKSNGVCTDTRSLEKGQIFFALKGPNFNGNGYAEKALKEGASLAVIDEEAYEAGSQYFLVKDALEALQDLARYHRDTFDIPFFGMTGSNGKTTTKELAARVLATQYAVHYTKGNFNNHIGVPLTVLSTPAETDIALIEMGANHLGDIALLCDIAKPTHGLITNIGNAHLGEFGGYENLIRAKSELFDYLRKTDGKAFINMEDKVLSNMSKRFPEAIQYPNEFCQLASSDPYVNYLDENGQEHASQLIGEYNFSNIAAAVSMGKYFEIEDPYEAIDRYLPENNRSEVIDIKSNKIVLDAYNANPASMEAALQNLIQMKGDTKVILLGEMKELGEYSDDEHRKIVRLAQELGLSQSFWVGEGFEKVISEKEKCFANVDELSDHLEQNPLQGATVLIKGSRSTQMEKLTLNKKIWT